MDKDLTGPANREPGNQIDRTDPAMDIDQTDLASPESVLPGTDPVTVIVRDMANRRIIGLRTMGIIHTTDIITIITTIRIMDGADTGRGSGAVPLRSVRSSPLFRIMIVPICI